MGFWPFKPSRAEQDAERLLSAVTVISRNPAFFGDGKTPDTLEGRFELLTLFACMALIRMQREPALAPLAQAFTDKLFRAFDSGLRELGVSDTAVPKRMHQLAGAFYGRLKVYADAVAAADPAALAEALQRNMVGEPGAAFALRLAGEVIAVAAGQAEQPVEALFRLDSWPAGQA